MFGSYSFGTIQYGGLSNGKLIAQKITDTLEFTYKTMELTKVSDGLLRTKIWASINLIGLD